VVELVLEVLDPETVDALLVNFQTVLQEVFTESPTPGVDAIVIVTVVLNHLGITSLTTEQLDELQAALGIFLNFNISSGRYLQAGSGLELISVGDATIVGCSPIIIGDCVGTASKVTYSTMPGTTSAPTVKSGKSGKSKSSKGSSSPTIPGVTMSPTKTSKSGKGSKSGKSRIRI
jgi:hypothetical protein